MLGNPYEASQVEHGVRTARSPSQLFAVLVAVGWRAIASPILGAVFGAIGGGIAMAIYFCIENFSLAPAQFITAVCGAFVVGILATVYGMVVGFAAGAIAVPVLLFVRRFSPLDLTIVVVVAAIIGYVVFDSLERTPDGGPRPEYMVLRVAACAAGAGAVTWFLGRGSGRRNDSVVG